MTVKSTYVYLGTTVPLNDASWRDHTQEALRLAKRRSADLLWICRRDRGIRPRTATTLWQATVRPLLESACEIWDGQVSMAFTTEVERIQTSFIRSTLGLHRNGSGVADVVVRAEVGSERLTDRWAKRKLGFWRRVFLAPTSRILRKVADFRHNERLVFNASITAAMAADPTLTRPPHNLHTGYGSRGWMPAMEATLTRVGLAAYWPTPDLAVTSIPLRGSGKTSPMRWWIPLRTLHAPTFTTLPGASTQAYLHLKDWDTNPLKYSFSVGEEGRRGMR